MIALRVVEYSRTKDSNTHKQTNNLKIEIREVEKVSFHTCLAYSSSHKYLVLVGAAKKK